MIRKLLLTGVLLLIIIIHCFAQFPYDEHLGPKPKGKIDSVITTLSDRNKLIAIFDKKRQLVEFHEYRNTLYEFGMVRDTTRTVYYYDKKGILSKSVRFNSQYYPGSKPQNWTDTTLWHFVKEGDIYIAKFDHQRADGIVAQEIFTLNKSFQLIKKTDNAWSIGVEFKTYDKNGYLIKERRTDKREDGRVLDRSTYYINDANGNLMQRNAEIGPVFNYTYIKFDKMHNWVERNFYKFDTEDKENYLVDKALRRITYYK
jgi:hypothetical protein